jgi:sulfoxide reductase catalytic subunit YedY
MGFAGAGLAAAGLSGCSRSEPQPAADASPALNTNSQGNAKSAGLYPAARNPEFGQGWKLSEPTVTGKYNNFYEFSTIKDRVHKLVDRFQIDPWPIQIGGLVQNPLSLDLAELIAMFPLEERIYRLRCVEAWAMIVPWTGFPLRKLLEKVQPKSEAKFVRFQSFLRPNQAPGQSDTTYPWPYTEGLRLDEAMNDLTLVTTGIYGKPLPKQNGAPIRIVVPWKYGYKSIKSVVKIDLVDKQPRTLWETLAPDEYPFESNVNPAIPHPRWSQATERMIDTGNRVNTQIYNGYAKYVASLYGPA